MQRGVEGSNEMVLTTKGQYEAQCMTTLQPGFPECDLCSLLDPSVYVLI